MKLVRQYINEKFEEETDPIHDMGIGLKVIYDNIKPGDTFMLIKDIPTLGEQYKQGICIEVIKKEEEYTSGEDITIYYNQYNSIKDYQHKRIDHDHYDYSVPWVWTYDFFKNYFRPIYIKP